MKKLFALIALLALLLCACGQKEETQVQVPETTVPVTTTSQLSELLTTMETDSGLTLMVLGKKTEYSVGIREILVYKEDTLLQSVLISEAIAKDGANGIDMGYSAAPDLENAVQLQDVNFDGYPDLQVCGWMPNNAFPYYFWCFDPETSQFEYTFTLQLQGVDPVSRQLIAWYKVEKGLYHTDYYEVGENNQLRLVDQQTEDVRPR